MPPAITLPKDILSQKLCPEQCQDDERSPDTPNGLGSTTSSESLPLGVSQNVHTQYQMMFDKEIQNPLKFQRYNKVAVLLLEWEPKETDLDTGEEVAALQKVFQSYYGYEVIRKYIQTGHRKYPRLIFNKHLADFMCDYSEPGNLLIIYYAGHGWRRDKSGELYLHGTPKTDGKPSPEEDIAVHAAEQLLKDTAADIFGIFDCCYAGNICKMKSRGSKPAKVEYLGACAEDDRTPGPGKRSFTTALIQALNNLSKKSYFSVDELQREIVATGILPENQYPPLGDRFHPSPEHIMLAPFRAGEPKIEPTGNVSAEFVDLRFHFPSKLNENSFRRYVSALGEWHGKNNDIGISHIKFIKKVPMQSFIRRYAFRWIEHTNEKKAGKRELLASSEPKKKPGKRQLRASTEPSDLKPLPKKAKLLTTEDRTEEEITKEHVTAVTRNTMAK